MNKKVFRLLTVIILIFAVVLSTPLVGAFSLHPPSEERVGDPMPGPRLYPSVERALEDDSEPIEILVKLKEQVDTEEIAHHARLKSPPRVTPKEEKLLVRQAVVEALKENAERTQKPILKFLEGEKAKGRVLESRGYFIVNLIYVKADAAVVRELSRRPDVDVIMPNTVITLVEPHIQEEDEAQSSSSAEWNIERINAPAVWDAFNIDGSGVVVGMIDTGVYWEHEALKEKWRGYNSEDLGTPNPELNWFDAVYGEAMPRDLSTPHGTHVMGTILGSSPDGPTTGVAPGAKWIAANAFKEQDGKITAFSNHLLDAAQYLLDPVDSKGKNHPDMAPDIINNSWGGTSEMDEWFRDMVQSWRSAEILPVFAAGNSGPGAGSIINPANYPESFAVGALDRNNQVASFSSRGPGPYPGIIKPDISAPGVSIRSTIPEGYQTWQGTSMAAPHIAGVAALLRSADPNISVAEIEALLKETATPLTDSNYTESPNYGYGYGMVNAFAAVEQVFQPEAVVTGQVLVEGEDTEPPTINHLPISSAYAEYSLLIEAEVSDDISALEAEVLFREKGSSQWLTVKMERISGDHRQGEYNAVIPWYSVSEEGLEYKIRARDFYGNTTKTPLHQVEVSFGISPGAVEDFSHYPQGWYWDGDWQWGTPSVGPLPETGDNLMATNLSGSYNHNTSSFLMMPPLDLREASSPLITFNHWYDIEYWYDEGIVWTTDDYGSTWDILASFTGRNQVARVDSINLQDYAGSENQVFIVFALYSDYSISYPGWYIDAVSLVEEDDQNELNSYTSGIAMEEETNSSKPQPPPREININLRRDIEESPVYLGQALLEGPTPQPLGLPAKAQVTVVETGEEFFTNPADGTFYLSRFLSSEEEVLTLRAEAEGYLPQEETVVMLSGVEMQLNFFLLKDIGTLGDVNEDGEINVLDAVLILKHIVGLIDLEEEYGPTALDRAKVSGSGGKLNAGDAILILRYLVGLIDSW